jgi:glycosyltransferase involved in cell wall biosynthesis
MEKLGVRVKLLCPYDMKEPLPQFGLPLLAYFHHAFRLVKLRREVEAWVKSGWPDLIYYRKGLLDPGFSFASSMGRDRLCVEMNGTSADSHGWSRFLLGGVCKVSERRKLQQSRLIITVTPGLRELLLRKHEGLDPGKIMVVNNGVDTDLFYPRSRESCRKLLHLDQSAFILLFAGKMARWHGLDTALDALAILREGHGEKPRLILVGEGPALPNLRRRVQELNLGEMVCFRGMVSQEEVAVYIGAADACIAPFTSERNDRIGISPLKIFEYTACDRPVICSDVRGVREIAEEVGADSEIVLIPPDDSAALAAAVREMLRRQNREMKPRKVRMDRVSWTARAEMIYQRLLRELGPVLSGPVRSMEGSREP